MKVEEGKTTINQQEQQNNSKQKLYADEFLSYLRQRLVNSFDISFREIQTDRGIIYAVFDGISTDKNYISEFIIAPIMRCKNIDADIEKIKNEIISANNIVDVTKQEDGMLFLLSGCVILIFPFLNKILSIEAKGLTKRNISIPVTEAGLCGRYSNQCISN